MKLHQEAWQRLLQSGQERQHWQLKRKPKTSPHTLRRNNMYDDAAAVSYSGTIFTFNLSHCSLSYWVFCNGSQSWFKNTSVRTHPAESGGWTIKKAWAGFKSLFQSPWLCLLYLWCHVISVFISDRNLGRVVEYGPGCHKNKDNNLYWKCSLDLFLDLCTHQDLPFLNSSSLNTVFSSPRSLLLSCRIILKYQISSLWFMYVFWFDIQSCYISSVHPVLP